MSHLLKSRSRNSAFTLVELLIVIAIIGILASLATVGVMKALEKGKMVAARTEISQLEAAIAAAKQNFGNVDTLPSIIELYSNGPKFQSVANETQTNPITGLIEPKYPNTRNTFNFFTKAFGKNWYASTTIPWLGTTLNTNLYATQPKKLYGIEALVFLLGGYADGSTSSPNFLGFSSNPLNPMDITNAKYKIKGPFYEFDKTRIKPSTNFYSMVNGWDGPYAYFSSSDYAYFLINPISIGGGLTLTPYHKNATPPVSAGSFYNAKTFQIISSGQDQSFGLGGYYNPPYSIGLPVYDDLANFSSTQLGKKDE
jgi:prepilin-type N-terminal cleavage/methylation domain-containing protein